MSLTKIKIRENQKFMSCTNFDHQESKNSLQYLKETGYTSNKNVHVILISCVVVKKEGNSFLSVMSFECMLMKYKRFTFAH